MSEDDFEKTDQHQPQECAPALAAPCRWCGYNGPGYWQQRTHDPECPWHSVGGSQIREMVLKFHRMAPGMHDDLMIAYSNLEKYDNEHPRYKRKEKE